MRTKKDERAEGTNAIETGKKVSGTLCFTTNSRLATMRARQHPAAKDAEERFTSLTCGAHVGSKQADRRSLSQDAVTDT